MQEEVCHIETSLTKAQKAVEIAETEVGLLRDELRQSSDRETSVHAQAPSALKEAHEILQEEMTTQKCRMEALTKDMHQRLKRSSCPLTR